MLLSSKHNDDIIEGVFTEYSVSYIFHVFHELSHIKRVKCSMKQRRKTLHALLSEGYTINKIEEIKQ